MQIALYMAVTVIVGLLGFIFHMGQMFVELKRSFGVMIDTYKRRTDEVDKWAKDFIDDPTTDKALDLLNIEKRYHQEIADKL